MKSRVIGSFGPLGIGVIAVTFAFTLTLRVWGIGTRFWLLGDQMRDWAIALGPFSELPLIGPATHVGGYTIGPAFYWILWGIRVLVGPWFQNLPHAGGIGQAILQSGADTLLLVAVWRRTRSPWIALTTIVLVSTAAYDLCLAALVWNPTMGSTLAKAATALVLLDWHRGSTLRVAVVALLAWSAVHAYTGAIFVAVSVFAALVIDPFARSVFERRQHAPGPTPPPDRDPGQVIPREGPAGAREAWLRRALGRDWSTVRRNAAIIAVVVAALQVPYVVHQVSTRFNHSAMGAVSGSVGRILSGTAPPEIAKSVNGYVAAFQFIELGPWQLPLVGWLLLTCGGIVAFRYRRDPALLAMTLLPQLAAIAGYALFLDEVDNYYYLSLMPAAVLTVVLAAMTLTSPRLARAVGIALLVGALALVPARVRFAATMHRMPQYGLLVDASRKIKNRREPMRSIRTDFALPPTSDPEFLFRVLGGRIDPASPWIGIIGSNGQVVYQRVGGS